MKLEHYLENLKDVSVEGRRILELTIEEIFNDFESRTCESCKFNEIDIVHDDIFGWCNEICYQVEHFKTSKNFGCSKWKSK